MASQDVHWLFVIYCVMWFSVVFLPPQIHNIYCFFKYKVSAAKHSKQVVDTFCRKSECLYILPQNSMKFIALFLLVPGCVLAMRGIMYVGDGKDIYIIMLSVIVVLFAHICLLYIYLDCKYSMCCVSESLVLIRCPNTRFMFTVICPCEILNYKIINAGYSGRKSVLISTNNKKFIIMLLENTENLSAALDSVIGNKNSV